MASKKYEFINEMQEVNFRQQIVIPLLKKMGYLNVRERHGSDEYGKDIVCCETNDLTTDYIAVVAKRGDVSGRASNSHKNKIHRLSDVEVQIQQSFRVPYTDVTDRGSNIINKVIVWISGKFTSNANHQILHHMQSTYPNITFVDGEKTIELVDKYIPMVFQIGDTGISSYFNTARNTYSKLTELVILGDRRDVRQIPSVFVSPTLIHIKKRKTKQEQQESKPPTKYDFSRLMKIKGNTAIIGDMGTGKSTILRRILLEIVDQNFSKMQKFPIPIILSFTNLRTNLDQVSNEDEEISQIIEEALAKEYSRFSDTDKSIDIHSELENGNICVLLDGLDEVGSDTQIEKMMHIVNSFVRRYRKSRVILTSRILNYFRNSDVLNGFTIYKIQDLSKNQMFELIDNWFGNASDSKKLVKLITKPINANSIPATPLTLALLATLFESGASELPANLTELFQKYGEISLGKWDIGKGINSQIDWQIKKLILRKTAWKMLNSSEWEILPDDFEMQVATILDDIGLVDNASTLMNEIVHRSGLLMVNENDRVTFRHHAFCEFFAGDELSQQNDITSIIVNNFLDISWSRVIFFAFGLQREGGQLEAVLNKVAAPEVNSFGYALQIGLVAQASYLAPRNIKIEAAKRSLYSFVDAWDEFVAFFDDYRAKKPQSKTLSHMFTLHLIGNFVIVALGSRTLAAALSEITEEYLNNHLIDNLSQNNLVKIRWFRYFLALANLHAENIQEFIQICNRSFLIDPAFLYTCILEIEIAIEDDYLELSYKKKLQVLKKQLEKNIKNDRSYINGLYNQLPKLLNDGIE